ncbi:hypothetical protein [Spirillospora sp. CA-294931]|uniref:hypothetical protein n=1 Tax=Spirillospora sp. CA-294931 TaxID=3240042 RepID=UPI003D8D912D
MTETERMRLHYLASRIQVLSDQHWNTFAGPLRAMSDHAWVGGTTAAGYADRLERSDRDLHTQLRKALDLIEDKTRFFPLG